MAYETFGLSINVHNLELSPECIKSVKEMIVDTFMRNVAKERIVYHVGGNVEWNEDKTVVTIKQTFWKLSPLKWFFMTFREKLREIDYVKASLEKNISEISFNIAPETTE